MKKSSQVNWETIVIPALLGLALTAVVTCDRLIAHLRPPLVDDQGVTAPLAAYILEITDVAVRSAELEPVLRNPEKSPAERLQAALDLLKTYKESDRSERYFETIAYTVRELRAQTNTAKLEKELISILKQRQQEDQLTPADQQLLRTLQNSPPPR